MTTALVPQNKLLLLAMTAFKTVTKPMSTAVVHAMHVPKVLYVRAMLIAPQNCDNGPRTSRTYLRRRASEWHETDVDCGGHAMGADWIHVLLIRLSTHLRTNFVHCRNKVLPEWFSSSFGSGRVGRNCLVGSLQRHRLPTLQTQ